MPQLDVAASTFPFLYSHSGLGRAEAPARASATRAFEMMIFPPHCWPAEMSAADAARGQGLARRRGRCAITSFCYPLLDNNPNSTDRLMRDYTLARYREAIDLAAEWGCPYVVAIPGPVGTLINPPRQWMLDWFVEGTRTLVDHAKGTGVGILLENVPFTFLPSAQDMKDTAALIGARGGGQLRRLQLGLHPRGRGRGDPAPRAAGAERPHLGFARPTSSSTTGWGRGSSTPRPPPPRWRRSATTGSRCSRSSPTRWPPGADPDGDIVASHAILARHGWAPLG